MDEPTVEQKAERLARLAADRAAELALVGADKATKLAVDRAVKDANVDHTLHEHTEHLREINHSQEKMAAALGHVEASLKQMVISNDAVAKYVAEQAGGQFSRRTLWIGGLAAVATWVAIIATLASTVF